MFKTFCSALFAAVAFARGTNDGTSQENATEYRLLDEPNVSMTLYSYNSDNGGVQELHGDLEITSNGHNWLENIAYGFCIGMETGGWDCLRAETRVSSDKI